MTGNRSILNYVLHRVHHVGAQAADKHPCSRGQLEILRHPAIEYDALFRPVGVLEFHRIADAVKSILVEHFGGQFFVFPIAGHDVRPPHPDFQLLFVGNQFQLGAGDRHTDHAGL